MNPEEILHAWFERVWNKQDDEFVYQHMGSPCRITGLPESAHNPEGFIEFRNELQAGISAMEIKVLESMGDDEKTIGTCCVTGVHTKSKRAIEFCFAYTARFVDGKIVEATNIIDFLTLLQQVEEVPHDALRKSLTV